MKKILRFNPLKTFLLFFLIYAVNVFNSLHAQSASFSVSPSSTICAETIVVFTNTSQGSGLTCLWDFGDGTTSTLFNPTHQFLSVTGNVPVTDTVTLTVTDINGNTSSAQQVLTINPKPDIILYDANNYKYCVFSLDSLPVLVSIYNYSPNASNISSYTVNWGDGSGTQTITAPFNTQTPITHYYSSMGYFPFTLTATGINGCSATVNETITVQGNPVADFTPPSSGTNSGCAPFNIVIYNTSQNITSSTLTTINWGDGNVDTLPIGAPSGDSIFHTYTSSSCINGFLFPFEIEMKVENECGSSVNMFNPVNVFMPPQAEFSIVGDTFCVDNPVMFTNTSTGNLCASNPATFYTWDFGDSTTMGPSLGNGNNTVQQQVTHTFTQPGTYNVTLTASNNSTYGCGATDTSLSVVIVETYADFVYDTVCYGMPTNFTDSTVVPGGSVISWQWDFGDGVGTSSLQNPSYTYSSSGIYAVKLTVVSSNGCVDTVTHDVYVDSAIPDFMASATCITDTMHFTDMSTYPISPIVSWQWNFGDGTPDVYLQNPSHFYQNPGSYNVTLTVTNARGCISFVTKTIHVIKPEAGFVLSPGCIGTPVQFNDTSFSLGGPISSWIWDFGDSSNLATAQNPLHTYYVGGAYDIILIVTDSLGCIDTLEQPLYVTPNPVADFTTDTACLGTSTHFTDASNGFGIPMDYWFWIWGDGQTASSYCVQNPTHIYPQSGSYQATLIAGNSNGCMDTITKTVWVHVKPTADFSFNTVCYGDPVYFNENATTPFNTPIISYYWTFGDGTASNQQNPAHVYAQPGYYTVMLTVTDQNGCIDTISKMVSVPEAVADFTHSLACSNLPVQFTDQSTLVGGSVIDWYWDFGDGTTINGVQHPAHMFSSSGNYTVKLFLYGSQGCNDSIFKQLVIHQAPTAQFVADTVCFGNPTQFSDVSLSPGGQLTSWDWEMGGGITATTQNLLHTFTSPGNHVVQLVVTDTNACQDTTDQTVNVLTLPTVSFISDTVCPGVPVNMQDLSTSQNGVIADWKWDMGNGTLITGSQSPSYAYPTVYNQTTFTVNLKVTDIKGCSDSLSLPLLVHASPLAGFDFGTACLNTPTPFTDSSTINGGYLTSWEWNFDGTGTSVIQHPSYTFLQAGTFNSTLVVESNYGCRDTVVKQVHVDSLPEPDFSFSTSCTSSATQFNDLSSSNNGGIASWYWDFGNQNYSSMQHPVHHYIQLGTYNVTLDVTDVNGCSNSVTKAVYVNPSIGLDFSADTVCHGDVTVFNHSIQNPTAVPIAYLWYFGDGNTSITANPVHQYALAGMYSVTLNVLTADSCSESVTKTIIVSPNPYADFETDTVLIGDYTTFTSQCIQGGAPIQFYRYYPNDPALPVSYSITSYTGNASHLYSQAGYFNARLEVYDNLGCVDTILKEVFVESNFIQADYTATNVCHGNYTQFADNSVVGLGTVDSWFWDFDDGSTSTLQNPVHLYNFPGTYDVRLVVSGNNTFLDTIVNTVHVYPVPQADFSNTHACVNTTEVFQDISGIAYGNIVGWKWVFGNGTTSLAANPTITFANDTSYNVKLIVTSDMGCMDTIIRSLDVYPLPQVDVSSDINEECTPAFISFCADITNTYQAISDWNWSFGDGNSSDAPVCAGHSYLNSGSYDVELEVTDDKGCVGKAGYENFVKVHPNPIAEFVIDNHQLTSLESKVQFTDMSIGASQWEWHFGDGTMSNLQSPEHQYTNIGEYEVVLFAKNQYGCTDSSFTRIFVNSELTLYVPNAFSPNGDGHNDVFKPVGDAYLADSYEFYIYNRFGNEVFSTTDVNQGWDGKVKGNSVQTGVYLWKVILKDSNGLRKPFTGHVTLIK